jgi:hypothetical protein
MSAAGELLFNDARAALARELATLVGRNDLNEAFVAWLLPTQHIGLTIQGPARVAAGHAGAQRTYQDVAVLGFAAAAGTIEPPQRDALNTGLKWLAGREPFVDGSPMGFCTDAVALLGVALGATRIGEDATKGAVADWMGKFLSKCYEMRGVHDWQRCLFAAAKKEVGAVLDLVVPEDTSVADVRVALRAKGVLPMPQEAREERDETDALLLLKRESGISVELARAALRIAAFDWINRCVPVVTPSRATADDVCQLLRRVPAGLRRWTWEEAARTSGRGAQPRKWHIDNEYHVQNLLWVTLAPIFPDLKDEEYTPSVGPLQPRADICIPSLNLIIEVKFMRANKAARDLIEEIAADASLYLTRDSSYKSIIAFVWDDSSRIEQHDILISGIKQIKGVIDAVIVPRPGGMTES